MNLNYYSFFVGLLICPLFFSCNQPTEETPKPPNIIYVLADDLGYGDVGAFNPDSKIPTPHLDKLAAQGMIFTDAHTSSSVCTPTRYGILTGRYNWRSRLKQGVLTGKSKALIPSSRTTAASLLKAQGYQTAYIGKWHLGWDWSVVDSVENKGAGWNIQDFDAIDYAGPITNNPNDLGFDYAYGHSGSLDMAPYVYVENGKATALPDTITENKGKYSWWRKGPTASDFDHDDVTPNFFRRGIQYVKEHASDEKPFFLYLPLPSPHTPILPTEEWQGKSGLNPYGDFVMLVDDYMGRLTQAVKEAGIEENTMIIFTSDNGCSPAAKIEEMTAKGHYPSYVYRGHKADIYEGGHRVPFIVKWPARVAKGSSSDQTICTTDFVATCAALTGYALQDHEGEDSYSMLPVLDGSQGKKPLREATVHHSINGSFAIRKGDWKLIMCPGSGGWSFPRPNDKKAQEGLPRVQLYNLTDDPAEKNNLQAANPEKVAELQELLTQYIKNGRSTPGAPQTNEGEMSAWKQLWWINS